MASPLKVMGLDLSYTRTGVCVWDGVQALPCSVESSQNLPYIERAQEIRSGIWGAISTHSPDVLCIESPLTHAFRAEMLTGLFYLILDRCHYCLTVVGHPLQAIVVLSNPSMRSLMGIRQGRGSKDAATKTEFKKEIVRLARERIGHPIELTHDEADAFHLAYYARRFWLDWKDIEKVALTDSEKGVWYSEEPVTKAPKKPRKLGKRVRVVTKKKGVIFRQGEFLFLSRKGV